MIDGPGLNALVILDALLTPALIVGVVTRNLARYLVRGTRARSRIVSIYRVATIGAIAGGVTSTTIATAQHRWAWTIIDAAITAIWVYWYHHDFPDDDDDWFNGRGKKIRRWARRRLTIRRTTPATTR